MSDRAALVLAAVTAVGAAHPARWTLAAGLGIVVAGVVGGGVVGGGVVGGGVVGRRWWQVILVVALGLFGSGLAQRSLDGLDGVRSGSVAGAATLLSDPAPSFGGLRADVRIGGRRLEARADGSAKEALEDRLAGEVLQVRGRIDPAGEQPWLARRHVAGRLTVVRIDGWAPGGPVARLANRLRRLLVAGAASLDAREQALYTGLVIGDDRHQPADLGDQFLGAGLTHLLAVSGANVAFALAMVGPLLRRLRLWPRLLATLGVIGLFGVMTRFEPSVLRASAMAALAAVLAMPGRPVSRVAVMALAVTGLLLVDPLLVGSVGFGLSVSASLAIVLVAPRLAARLPGPSVLREPLAVTLAAQLGVAPILLTAFGPIPVASLPANLLAVPVAGGVMIWGLTAGLAAGVLGGPFATLVHLPTRLALAWLELVAARLSGAPLGQLGGFGVAALAIGLTVAVTAAATSRRRSAGWVVVGIVLLAAAGAVRAPPLRTTLEPGVVRWHAGSTDVVVLGGVGGRTELRSSDVLAALRVAGIGTIDLLVVADASVPVAVVDDVTRSHPTGTTVVQRSAVPDAPPGSVVRVGSGGGAIELGRLLVQVVVVPDRLVVDCRPQAL